MHSFYSLRALACVTLAASLVSLASADDSITAAKRRAVVLISLDGFPAYALDDPRLPVPELRALAKRGAWARRMTVSNPTVTWPNHTTLVTGVPPSGHSVLFNGRLMRTNTGPWTVDASKSKDELVAVPTLYDVAHARGLSTAQVAWVAIDGAVNITYAFREQPAADDPLVVELQRNGILTAADAIFDSDLADALHDQIRVKVASYLVRRYRPNLLLVHLASVDSANHLYGPGTSASYNAMALVDSGVRDLRTVLDAVMGPDGYTIVVVSDHGFKQFTHQLVLPDILRAVHCGETCKGVAEGGGAMLYLSGERTQMDVEQLAQALRNTPGVSAVVKRGQFRSIGLPQSNETSRDSPDFVFYAQPGYVFTDAAVPSFPTDHATHGYAASDPDMDGIFFAAGYGIRRGITLERIRNLDVAPTLARLLGLSFGEASSQVTEGILAASTQSAGDSF